MLSDFTRRLEVWSLYQGDIEQERQRVAFLNGPLPKSDAKLFEPVKVHVLHPFFLNGKPAKPGDTVSMMRHDAVSMAALGRCEILE